jgi:hypothetical protein
MLSSLADALGNFKLSFSRLQLSRQLHKFRLAPICLICPDSQQICPSEVRLTEQYQSTDITYRAGNLVCPGMESSSE